MKRPNFLRHACLALLTAGIIATGCSDAKPTIDPDSDGTSANGEPRYDVLTLVVEPATLDLRTGKSAKLMAELKGPGSGPAEITWSSSMPSVVSVYSNGTVIARNTYYIPDVIITASVSTESGMLSESCIVKVIDPGVSSDINIPADIYADYYANYLLSWSEEFNYTGAPDPAKWGYEIGYRRNNEAQYYREENAKVTGGRLIITGEPVSTPLIDGTRSFNYASASIQTRNLHNFLFGIFEIRARIPTCSGAWPAVWTMGFDQTVWPYRGEVDILEYFRQNLYCVWHWAYAANNTTNARSNSANISLANIAQQCGESPEEWAQKFHIWRYVWGEEWSELYIDNIRVNRQDTRQLNPSGVIPSQPFLESHYLKINLALGGNSGGTLPANSSPLWPITFEVDYVRWYEHKSKTM